ncbi:MAG: Fe-S cluster assembly protein SufD [Myxococcales bacterium]|nr:Fe-S cluster assembly protein SufD [Myxococcales bacterium]
MSDVFQAAFAAAKARRAAEPQWLREMREAAMARFGELGLPTTKHEDWKYTNVAALSKLELSPAGADGVATVARDAVTPLRVEGCDALVFVDGRYAAGLSAAPAESDGVTACSLAAAIADGDAALEAHFGNVAPESGFTTLNTALAEDGAFVHVAAGKRLERPLQLIFLTGPNGARAAHVRNVIVCERGAELTIVETHAALEGRTAPYLSNVVDEIVVGENATVDHVKLSHEGAAAHHVATIQAHQARDSNFRSRSFALGGLLTRNDINTRMDAENIHATLDGLFVVDGDEHVDHHTIVDHAKPHCGSHELYKGVLGGKSRGVFNGKIFVRQDAQKIDAIQNNKNLLLSDSATVNTKPQLEIFADDVRCTHGATVGQLDEDALFYLRARGISREVAHTMLVYAFAGEIIDGVRHEAVREHVEGRVRQRLAAVGAKRS